MKSQSLLKNAMGDSSEALEHLEGFSAPAQGGNVALVTSSIPEGPELLCHGFNSTLISEGSLAAMVRYGPGPGSALPSQEHGVIVGMECTLSKCPAAFRIPKIRGECCCSASLGEHGWDGKR